MGNCFSGGGDRYVVVAGTSSAPHTYGANEAMDNFLRSGYSNGQVAHIELSLSVSDLHDRNVLSTNDPMAVVYMKVQHSSLQELGRTEVVLNSLNPKWIKKINITYYFGMVQTLLFRVYDVDTQLHGSELKSLKLDDRQYLGEATCTLSQIMTNTRRVCTLDLVSVADSEESSLKSLAKLTVHAEERVVSTTTSELMLRCTNLKKKDFFSKSNPFLLISKYTESRTTVPICRTEVLKNNLNPVWKPIFLNISQVGSKDHPLLIECFNVNSYGKHDLIGRAEKSLAQLENLCSNGQGEKLALTRIIGKGSPRKKTLNSQIFVEKFSESDHSFLDYLLSGCELNFMVAIDFTSSNGDPREPDSLHYIDPFERLNEYQKAIMEVGEVIKYYDSDGHFPSWGFGARISDGPVNHCFNLNGSMGQPAVAGIHGIMLAYESCLRHVSLAGPTRFGPVITSATNIASQSVTANEDKYFVLLIITDGVVTDLQETKDALVKASYLPLSILIVGVGGANFNEMGILHADNGEKLISSTGLLASRDIVQFVRFRDVQGEGISVVQSLLAELPSQFLTYMRNNGIQSRTPPPTTL